MRWVAVALGAWAWLSTTADGLVLKRGAEDPEVKEYMDGMEKEVAKEYMKEWKPKRWDEAKHSCDTSKLPKTTDRIIFGICGADAEQDRCICNIAKAHSCHVGCRKIHTICPSGCQQGKCFAGDPSNGGAELSGGLHHGQCHASCSAPIGGYRYCGSGFWYQQGLFEDCAGCKPVEVDKLSKDDKKDLWLKCMTDCFPTPSCEDMCGEGTADCKIKCAANYMHVVEPYWEIFKGSLQHVPLLAKDDGTHEELGIQKKDAAGPMSGAAGELAEMAVDKEEVVEQLKKEEDKKEEQIEEVKEELKEDEWEDEDDWDDEDWDDEEWEDEGEYEDEGEWEDPWAGQHEYDDDDNYDDGEDEYYEFHLHGVKTVGSGHSHGHLRHGGPHHHHHHHHHGKRKRRGPRTLSRHKYLLRKARALGLAPPAKRHKPHNVTLAPVPSPLKT